MPADKDPPMPAAPRRTPRSRHLLAATKDLAPYVGLALVWVGMSFCPWISAEGKAEGHGLLMLFAGLITNTRRNPTDAP